MAYLDPRFHAEVGLVCSFAVIMYIVPYIKALLFSHIFTTNVTEYI